jgi:hypothetical protein
MSAQKLYPAGHSIQHLFMGVLALTFLAEQLCCLLNGTDLCREQGNHQRMKDPVYEN